MTFMLIRMKKVFNTSGVFCGHPSSDFAIGGKEVPANDLMSSLTGGKGPQKKKSYVT